MTGTRLAHWFGPAAELREDERWVLHLLASRTQNRLSISGGLHLTTQRVFFTPSAIHRLSGGKAWCSEVSEIASVGVVRGRFTLWLLSGAHLDRMLFVMNDGRRELFGIRRCAACARTFREILGVPESADLPTARVLV